MDTLLNGHMLNLLWKKNRNCRAIVLFFILYNIFKHMIIGLLDLQRREKKRKKKTHSDKNKNPNRIKSKNRTNMNTIE